MIRHLLCNSVRCSALLLMVSLSLSHTALASGPPTESPAGDLMTIPTADVHAEAEHECFCRVILVPVKAPSPSISVTQSSERFSIHATFHSTVGTQQRAVIQQAVDEWEAITETRGFTPADYPIAFSFAPLSGTTLGQTTTTYYEPSGNLASADIVFDSSPSVGWFVDPTPADDVEFDDAPPSGIDLLTIARHEIAHAIGWVATSRVTRFIDGKVFDPARLNVATTHPDGLHADPSVHADDLMVPLIGPSTRRSIALYPDSTLMARAFHYDITMRFVDGWHGGAEQGSANAPWDSFTEGVSLTPWDYRLLVIPWTYREAAPLILDTPMTISAARGGDVVVTGP